MGIAKQSGELVFAFVAPVGTDYRSVAEFLQTQLFGFGYTCNVIKLSQSIGPLCKQLGLDAKLRDDNDFVRTQSHMKAANSLYQVFNKRCEVDESNALLALDAIEQIRKHRLQNTTDKGALHNTAHILLTLKRPEEVNYLRRIYALGLHVIGVFSPEEDRATYLMHKRHVPESEARKLIEDDQNDQEAGGQRTGDAFHHSDLFIDIGGSSTGSWEQQVTRYLELLFSHPYRTPSRDEQAMFMAFGASLRSAQFGRQVGAAISDKAGEILAVGCNEVPAPGGGLYWEEDRDDQRDHKIGMDSNDTEKHRILKEIMVALPKRLRTEETKKAIRATSLFSITEFGRAVHAEMEALSSCARRGVSTKDTTLYTTTFPCHNCARHIVGFGVTRVVYIEPYPKSKAIPLHEDAIVSSAAERDDGSHRYVIFSPFVGISPRRYSEMFTVSPTYGNEVTRKEKSTGNAVEWDRSTADLRLQMYSISYIEREELAVTRLGDQLAQRVLSFSESNANEEK